MEFYERVSGARLHANYIRPGGVMYDISKSLLKDINFFSNQFNFRLNEIDELLTDNRIWKQRLIGIGIIESKEAIENGFSGVMLRSTGVC
jgi:NADH dehydrogenase (ubiquinone) Fe-S protein 2